MTTTITVSTRDGDEAHEAAYFNVDNGFVTLKTAEHKFVAAYPSFRVDRIVVKEAGA